MKLKIAIFSAVALSLILIALDGFIYFTLSNHMMNLNMSALSNKAAAIGQYYASQVNGGPGESDNLSSASAWMNQFRNDSDSIAILSRSGEVLFNSGEYSGQEIRKGFSSVKNVTQFTKNIAGDMDIWTIYPIPDEESNRILAYVVLVSDNSNVSDYLDSLLTVMLIGSAGAVLLAAVGGYIISSVAVRPLNQMIQLVERIQANRMDERVNVPKGHDEIARLASTFNRMLARIERSFEQQSRFVADASHEIRTPLTTIHGYASLLERWGKHDPNVLSKAIRVIQKESLRLRDLANDLLTLASVDVTAEQSKGKSKAAQVAEEVVDALTLLHPNLVFHKQLSTYSEVVMPSHNLKRVISNILDNASKHTGSGGEIFLDVFKEGKNVVIRIRDTGKGIPAEDLPHIFERFYRVDKSRARKQGGTGLGLAIVKELVKSYGGSIEIESELGQGTTVFIRLPEAFN